MPTQKRFLPRPIGRFNYWEFFRPDGIKVVSPLKQRIKTQFTLILTASPATWNKEVYPWLQKQFTQIPDRRFLALEGYVLDDKEWDQDPDAWKVYRQLSSSQQKRITQLSRKKWHYRSQWNWDSLIKTIAADLARFEAFLETPDTKNLVGTDRRIYEIYHKQARKLLDRGQDIQSLAKNRQAKRRTLHWFHHALRNMKEYRNNRPPVPWSSACTETCHRIQKKLFTA
jgi:hypothetical protein